VGVRFSAAVQKGPGAHPASYTTGTGSFLGVKRPGRGVDHPPHLAPRLKKGRSIPLLHLWAFVACSRVNFNFNFTFTFPLPPLKRDGEKFIHENKRCCCKDQEQVNTLSGQNVEFLNVKPGGTHRVTKT
jgi:hypothetical protein